MNLLSEGLSGEYCSFSHPEISPSRQRYHMSCIGHRRRLIAFRNRESFLDISPPAIWCTPLFSDHHRYLFPSQAKFPSASRCRCCTNESSRSLSCRALKRSEHECEPFPTLTNNFTIVRDYNLEALTTVQGRVSRCCTALFEGTLTHTRRL